MNYYIKNRKYYYDFQYLRALSGFSSTKLQYLLDKEKIGRVKYQDICVYELDDLYKSEVFCDLIQPDVIVMDDN